MRGIVISVCLGIIIWMFLIGIASWCLAETVVYTPAAMPRLYQSVVPYGSTHWWPKNAHHGPASVGMASNPNMLYPWAAPAGTHNIARVRARRTLVVPDEKYILVWRERHSGHVPGVNPDRWLYRWTFPIGTIVSEQLFTADGRKFSDRSRTKMTSTEWDPDETIHFEPPGYNAESRDCMECHKDAGVIAQRLPGHFPGREWYGHLSGNDTVFTVRPVTITGQIHPLFRQVARYVNQRPVTYQRLAAAST